MSCESTRFVEIAIRELTQNPQANLSDAPWNSPPIASSNPDEAERSMVRASFQTTQILKLARTIEESTNN